jgi:uncharacterized protein YecE (DUF72 family)
MAADRIRVGTAGWSLRRDEGDAAGGSRLERYARLFSCVEINSSFYRPHRPATYARWAAAVPAGFRFSLKVPKEITHVRRMIDVSDPPSPAWCIFDNTALGEATANALDLQRMVREV